MKKLIVSALFVLGFGGYVLHSALGKGDEGAAGPIVALPQNQNTTVPPADAGTVPAPVVASTPPPASPAAPAPATPAPAPKPAGQYADGTYTGSVADAYYGNVQVRVTISGGRLTGVKFVQYPSDRSTSVYINGQAMPLLTQEALQAQGAKVSGVSGATDTSIAFRQSLGAALALAAN